MIDGRFQRKNHIDCLLYRRKKKSEPADMPLPDRAIEVDGATLERLMLHTLCEE